MQIEFDKNDLNRLREMARTAPAKIRNEVGKFLVRGIAVYNQGILRNPWRVGAGGGGAPVDTGNMRDTHIKSVRAWEASIEPTADYAQAVHKDRPWLDYVQQQKDSDIKRLENQLLENIIKGL